MKIPQVISILALALLCSCARSPSHVVPSPAQQLANEGAIAFNAKDYAKAQALAAQATSIDPQFAEAWVADGMASALLSQPDRARQAYERALSLYQVRHRLNPAEAGPVFQEIYVLSLLGRTSEAEKMLKQASVEYPNDSQIARLAGNFAEATRSWTNLAVRATR